MRIIAGEFRGRRLKSVPGVATRPTSDKLRETLFDVLGCSVVDSVWYDCFAGSGAVGLEALSRGAAYAVFIERGRAAARVLRSNIAALGLEQRSAVLEQAVAPALARARPAALKRPADFVFLDPPYTAASEYRRVLNLLAFRAGEAELLRPNAMVIAEHARRSPLEPRYGALARFRVLEQGSSALSFYRLSNPERPASTT